MKNLLFVSPIIIIALFLRFFSISSNPPSLTWDEASWGYNAYSLGIDGRDEFGKFLPLTYLESFGDFKPPVYTYLSVLPVKIFGLNEFSVRFTSAFFGILTVILTYLLTFRIFVVRGPAAPHPHPTSSRSLRAVDGGPPLRVTPHFIALIAAGLLAISPWHILLSRAAFEANVATFFIVLGVLLFLNAIHPRGGNEATPRGWSMWLLPLSIISFVISMYTFNTARIVAPLLVLGLVFAHRKYLITQARNQFLTSIVVGALIFLPLFLFLLTPQSKLRFQEVNIFSDGAVVERANQQIENDGNAFWSKIIHNRRLGYATEYVKHYFDNISPDFLFIRGDGNPKFSIRDVGQMYIWEIPFFIAGIFFLFRRREGHWWIIPYWLIVGIIPAGIARETPHALRIETTLPTFQILTAYGLVYLWQSVSSIQYRVFSIKFARPLAVGVLLFAMFNFVYFYHNYFKHYLNEFSSEWQYGYKDAVEFTSANESKFDQIIFTEELGRPYIYVLFHKQYDSAKFRQEAKVERE
ncbi:MAG: phospholipid carrier-dependent glycosyltransferase, partial [Candidatus Levybacteria bacterium]|nr:phospholipid carrier-dependent glycosyltransferase [Candidatus Levybacteria bacterium]